MIKYIGTEPFLLVSKVDQKRDGDTEAYGDTRAYGDILGAYGEHAGNTQGSSREHAKVDQGQSGNTLGASMEHAAACEKQIGKIRGTCGDSPATYGPLAGKTVTSEELAGGKLGTCVEHMPTILV